MQAISTFEDLLQRAATPAGTGIYSAEYTPTKHKQLLRERGGRAVCQGWGGAFHVLFGSDSRGSRPVRPTTKAHFWPLTINP